MEKTKEKKETTQEKKLRIITYLMNTQLFIQQ